MEEMAKECPEELRMDRLGEALGLQEGKTGLKSPQLATVLLSRVPGEQRARRTVRGRGACSPALGSQFSGHGGRDKDGAGPKWAHVLLHTH